MNHCIRKNNQVLFSEVGLCFLIFSNRLYRQLGTRTVIAGRVPLSLSHR